MANRFDAPSGACRYEPLIGAGQTAGLAGGFDYAIFALTASKKHPSRLEKHRRIRYNKLSVLCNVILLLKGIEEW